MTPRSCSIFPPLGTPGQQLRLLSAPGAPAVLSCGSAKAAVVPGRGTGIAGMPLPGQFWHSERRNRARGKFSWLGVVDKGVAASSFYRAPPRAQGGVVTGFCISIETPGFDTERTDEFEVIEVAMGL